MSSTSTPLRDRLSAAQKSLDLTAGQLAAALRITPEWLSKIMRGHVQGSDDIRLRLDELLRQRGVKESSTRALEGTSTVHEGPQAPYGSVELLEREVQGYFGSVFEQAKGDPVRLGWMMQQLIEYLAPPESWSAKSRKKFVRVTLPSQTQRLSSETGKPLPPPGDHGARSAS